MNGATSVELKAPNGTSWPQPTGLFINNEFINGTAQAITSVDPS
jgi:aldehyde dehydrogenase (NAD(P)+)